MNTNLEFKARKPLGFSLFFVLALFYLGNGINLAQAQSVQPMVYELTPAGSQSGIDLRIENTKSVDATYEMLAKKITYDEFGDETLSSAEDDFLIYPPQTLVPAGKVQIVKVKYIGDPSIEISQGYRIQVNELPVDLSGADFSGVAVAFSFSTLCNVAPQRSAPKINVTDISIDDEGMWAVKIENTGDRFLRLSDSVIEVSSTTEPANKKVFSAETVSQLFGKNTVPPRSTVIFNTPALEGFKPESTVIKISS